MEAKLHRLMYGVAPPQGDELYSIDYFLKLIFPTLRPMRHEYFDYGRDEQQRFKMTRSGIYTWGIWMSFVEIYCIIMKFKAEAEIGNWQGVTNLAATFSIALYFISRAYPLYLAHLKLGKVINEFDEIFPKSLHMQRRMETKKFAQAFERRFRIFHTFCIGAIIAFLGIPLLRFFVLYDGEGPLLDDYHADPSWLPFGVKQKYKYYWYVYVYEAYMVIFGTTHVMVQEHLFLVLMMQLQMHFHYLKRRIGELDARHTFHPESNEEYMREFKSCVKYFSTLQELSVKVNSLFDLAILCSDFICAASICFQMFLLTSSVDILLIFTFTQPLIVMIYLTFDSAKKGQDLQTVSNEVHEAFYNHNWYEGSETYQKLIITCLHQASKPCKLTAFELFDVNLEHFRAMMSLAYQMFAFLQSR